MAHRVGRHGKDSAQPTPHCWKARLITPSVVSERLKVNGSVARQAIRHLEDRGWNRRIGSKAYILWALKDVEPPWLCVSYFFFPRLDGRFFQAKYI